MSNTQVLLAGVDRTRLPRHIAIIPDGNGRWAQARSLSRLEGHVHGTANVKDLVIFASELGIKIVTIYAFSEENWLRPKSEVDGLMELLKEYLIQERSNLMKNKIQLRTLGNINRLPNGVLTELQKTIHATENYSEMILNFAISYGARQEILEAVQALAALSKEGKIEPNQIKSDLFSKFLYTSGLEDPDLLIRTSGEMRVSNFLLWQIAYAELYVTKTHWPDFDREAFLAAIRDYQSRERRYGMTTAQIKKGESTNEHSSSSAN